MTHTLDGPFEALLPAPGKRHGMPLDRETVTQIVLSFVAVLLLIAGSVFVSTNYGTNGNLTQQGGVALVATIGLFVVVMLAAGLYLERREF